MGKKCLIGKASLCNIFKIHGKPNYFFVFGNFELELNVTLSDFLLFFLFQYRTLQLIFRSYVRIDNLMLISPLVFLPRLTVLYVFPTLSLWATSLSAALTCPRLIEQLKKKNFVSPTIIRS